MKGRLPRTRAFTLVEVIVAVGVFAVAVTAALGLLSSQSRRASDLDDAQTAARLGTGIQQELERLKTAIGIEGLAAVIPPAESDAPMQLAAPRDGHRVLRCDGAAAAADRPLNDGLLPGIAWRDRFFLAEISQQLDLPFAAAAGYLAVTARISWPHRLPAGPATQAAVSPDADPSQMVPAAQRDTLTLNFVLRP
ncbi:MAG: hypothetical protein A3G75_11990 [Verrucomicrobia bacterium RIFCSPLOWO2_12_FULL_64_8]|nr:MAG: hypothetical protein A3G75_11990 [Verrucomicrobia bacterium RIFCSPLOWO2_12_FULL_64_8]